MSFVTINFVVFNFNEQASPAQQSPAQQQSPGNQEQRRNRKPKKKKKEKKEKKHTFRRLFSVVKHLVMYSFDHHQGVEVYSLVDRLSEGLR